jgi:putative membrane protein
MRRLVPGAWEAGMLKGIRQATTGAAVLAGLTALSGCIGFGYGPGGMMGPGYGWGMVGMGIIWILVVVGVVLLVILLFRQAAAPPPPRGVGYGPGPRTSRARDILDERYARGEIMRDQYLAMRRDLEGGREPPPGPPPPAAPSV